jgi:hypothetical protein
LKYNVERLTRENSVRCDGAVSEEIGSSPKSVKRLAMGRCYGITSQCKRRRRKAKISRELFGANVLPDFPKVEIGIDAEDVPLHGFPVMPLISAVASREILRDRSIRRDPKKPSVALTPG